MEYPTKNYPVLSVDSVVPLLKNSKLHIEKCAGKNLASKDLGGTSDPFIRVGWVTQADSEKFIQKTEILHETAPSKKSLQFTHENIIATPFRDDILRVEVRKFR